MNGLKTLFKNEKFGGVVYESAEGVKKGNKDEMEKAQEIRRLVNRRW